MFNNCEMLCRNKSAVIFLFLHRMNGWKHKKYTGFQICTTHLYCIWLKLNNLCWNITLFYRTYLATLFACLSNKFDVTFSSSPRFLVVPVTSGMPQRKRQLYRPIVFSGFWLTFFFPKILGTPFIVDDLSIPCSFLNFIILTLFVPNWSSSKV